MSSILAILIGLCGLPALQLEFFTFGRLRKPLFGLSAFFILLLFLLKPEKRKLLKKFIHQPITGFMALYAVCGVLSGLTSINKLAFMGAFYWRAYYMFIPWFTGSFIAERPRDWMAGVVAYVACSMVPAIYCVISGIQLGFHTQVGDHEALHRNILGDIVASSFIMALTLLLSARKIQWRVLCAAALAIDLVAIVATQSRGGLLALVTGSIVMGIMSTKTRIPKLIIPIALIACVLGAITLLPEDALEERMKTGEHTTAGARPLLWSWSFEYISEHPFQTVGWGNKPKTDTGKTVDNYCSFLLQDLIEAGWLEAIASLGILGSCIWMAFKNHRALPPDSPARTMNLLAIVIIVTRYLHGSLETYWDAIYEHSIVYYFAGYLTYTSMLRMKDESHKVSTVLIESVPQKTED